MENNMEKNETLIYKESTTICERELMNLDNAKKSRSYTYYYNEKALLDAMDALEGIRDYMDASVRLEEYRRCYDELNKNPMTPKKKKILFSVLGGVLAAGVILTAVLVPYNVKPAHSRFDDYTQTLIFDSKSKESVKVPKTVHFKKVKSVVFKNTKVKSVSLPDGISSWSFTNCDNLESVKIPSSATEIPAKAFYDCDALTSVTIPDGVTSIGDDAFRFCDALTSVTIPDSVTSIGNDAFFYCDALTSVNIPDSVTSIGDDAFSGCSSLTSITLSQNLTSLGAHAFSGCSSLKEITIPSKITDLPEYIFDECTSLKNVYFSDGIVSIGKYAFADCIYLTSITLPDTVKTIGQSAFYNCACLKYLTIPEGVTHIGSYAFGSTNLTTLTYAGTYESWLKIEKDADWNGTYNPVTTLVCSDQTVTLE